MVYDIDEQFASHQRISKSTFQPAMNKVFKDADDFLGRTVEEYKQWLIDNTREQLDFVLLDLIRLSQNQIVLCDCHLTVEQAGILEDIVVCDNGVRWLSILPQDDYYCITAMMNEQEEILLWYIDMIASQGIDSDGVPYFDDLYLDLVVYPNGTILVDDMDELEDALSKNDITQEQFELALETSKRLQEGLLSNIDSFIEYTKKGIRLLR